MRIVFSILMENLLFCVCNWLRKYGRVNEHYEKGDALSDSMVRSIHMLLHQAMDAAVQQRLVVKNPTNGTVIPKKQLRPQADPHGVTADGIP